MDTHLVEWLPKVINLKNGDAKIIKNAGAIVRAPFDRVTLSMNWVRRKSVWWVITAAG